MQVAEELFFDPFAEEGAELFDAAASFDNIVDRYMSGEIEHDYTADKFLADTQALMLDAQFVAQFDQLAYIAGRMHALCQHDAQLNNLMAESRQHNPHDQPDNHDGHEHEESKKKKKKKGKEVINKKPPIRRGWFASVWHNMNKENKK